MRRRGGARPAINRRARAEARPDRPVAAMDIGADELFFARRLESRRIALVRRRRPAHLDARRLRPQRRSHGNGGNGGKECAAAHGESPEAWARRA